MSAPRHRFRDLSLDWLVWSLVAILLPLAVLLTLRAERRREAELVRSFQAPRELDPRPRQAREEEDRQQREQRRQALEEEIRANSEARARREVVRDLARRLGVSEEEVRARLKEERQWQENEEIHRQQGTGCTAGMRRP
jgi:hypothetical protein